MAPVYAQSPPAAALAECDSLYRDLAGSALADSLRIDGLLALLRAECFEGDADSAARMADRAIAAADGLQDRPRQVAALRARAQVYFTMNDRASGIAALERCIPLLNADRDAITAEAVHMELGHQYDKVMDLARSMAHYEEALRSKEGRGDERGVAGVLNNIGIIQFQQGDVPGALRHHERCMAIYEALGDSGRVAATLNRIGVSLRGQGRVAESLVKHQRSLALYRALGREMGSSAALNNMAAAYDLLGEHDKAAACAQESLAIREREGETYAVGYSCIQLGWARLRQGRAAEAVKHGERARGIAVRIKLMTVERDACQLLHDAYKAIGDARDALSMHERFVLLRDSFYTEENQRAVLRQEYEHQAHQAILADSLRHIAVVMRVEQARAMERLLASAQRRQIVLGSSLVLVLALGTGYFLFDRRRRRMRYEREQAVLEERLRIADDLHDDLGAGLSSLKLRSALALERATVPEQQEALNALAQTADSLMDNMRQILWAMGTEHTKLADLVRYITVYARQQLDERSIALDTVVEGELPALELNAMQRRNIFLVVKEALHNVVKHARATRVTLAFRWANGLEVSVADNGTGVRVTNGMTGNGMRTMRKRAATLGGSAETTSGPRGGMVMKLFAPLTAKAEPGAPPSWTEPQKRTADVEH